MAGVRHSMGGQSMRRDGWVLDMQPLRGVEVDGETRVMRVGAGATWRDVIPVLNAAGFAPTVMQSNHDFTVGGSMKCELPRLAHQQRAHCRDRSEHSAVDRR